MFTRSTSVVNRAIRPVLRLAYRVQKRLWTLLRPRTRGVKVMLFNRNGELLLIRNSYGRSDLFVLPGGGIRPFEPPERAARREVREELGCGADGLTLLSTYVSDAEGKRDTIYLFRGQASGEPRPDGLEVVECSFHPLDAPPPATSPATRRRIEEYRGKRAYGPRW